METQVSGIQHVQTQSRGNPDSPGQAVDRPGQGQDPSPHGEDTPIAMEERIRRLNTYLGGWIGYFALAETPSTFEEIEGWIRRRLRMCLWRQWKRVRTRYRELRAPGLPEWVVHQFANARKGPWRMAHGPMNRVLGNAYWQAQGLMSLSERYRRLRQSW
ncbi:group II intron maturase-specific domain-containing protein [Kyrpidia spormannii]|uniref:group II intron maturase-specific domain-containing protein n=1 Tax=Kyrpidia spormannii TaxID=2055160 RepID=UPI0018E41CCF|nr:group II intron maturase-specific domain-containing protein [Kyrpidia spormannii]